MNSNIQMEIHQKAMEIVGRFKKVEIDLIEVLQKADEHRVYLRFECKNLHEYTMKILKLSESIAFNFIVVARKAKEVPQLKEVIESGLLSVSKARKITPVLTKTNQEQWLQMAVTLPQRTLEKEVAKVAPKEATPERMMFVSGERLSLQMGLSEELSTKLRRAQNLESQRRKRAVSLEETLGTLIEVYLEKQDPIRKAQRIQDRSQNKDQSRCQNCNQSEKQNQNQIQAPRTDQNPAVARQPIKSTVRHQVNLRDQGQCTHKDSQGIRCPEQRWIDIHHIVPRSLGGPDTVRNLTTLCSGHHRLVHLSAATR